MFPHILEIFLKISSRCYLRLAFEIVETAIPVPNTPPFDCRKPKDTWSPITYFRGDNSDCVHRRAHLFVAGHTFYWCTADRRWFRMRDKMASENLSSVIYDALRAEPVRRSSRRAAPRRAAVRCDRDVPWIRRDPPTCGHRLLLAIDYTTPILILSG